MTPHSKTSVRRAGTIHQESNELSGRPCSHLYFFWIMICYVYQMMGK
jgi:hypothetical protein